MIYIVSGIFVGQLGELLGKSSALYIAKSIPSYYLADGVINAIQNQGGMVSNLIDMNIVLGSSVALLTIFVWALRR